MYMKDVMQRFSILSLRGSLLVLALATLAVSVLVLPRLLQAEVNGDFDYGYILVGLYVTAIPFLWALFRANQLLTLVAHGSVFFDHTITHLRDIKRATLIIFAIYLVGTPYVFYLADKDDAPGLLALHLTLTTACFIIATLVGILQQLFAAAAEIKAENDLTV